MIPIHQILAVDQNYGLGSSTVTPKLPWDLPEEFQHFLRVATRQDKVPSYWRNNKKNITAISIPGHFFLELPDFKAKIVLVDGP